MLTYLFLFACLQLGGQRMMECYSERLQDIQDKNELSQRCEQVARIL